MPIYEYQCEKCDRNFEFLIEGDDKAACPKCDSKKVQRQLSVISSPQSQAASGGAPMPGGNCGLPQCGTGFG